MRAAPGLLVTVTTADPRGVATRRSDDVTDGFPTVLFDPDRMLGWYRSGWWQPLDGITTIRGAARLAGHFWRETTDDGDDDGDDDGSGREAQDLLAALILAAAVSPEPSLRDVVHWLEDASTSPGVETLRSAGHHGAAAQLQRLGGSPAGQRDSTYRDGLKALTCLRDPDVAGWVCPPRDHADTHYGDQDCSCEDTAWLMPKSYLHSLTPGPFTVHIAARPTSGGGAPLAAALLDRILHEAIGRADRDRAALHPRVTVVVDDAGQISGLVDLPGWMPHLAPRGIDVTVV